MNRDELVSLLLPEIKKVVNYTQIPPPIDDFMARQVVYIDFGLLEGRRIGFTKAYDRSVLEEMVYRYGINPVDHTLKSFINEILDYLLVLQASGVLGE